ncbi:hypothetical protein HCG75_01550 [Clostridium sp. K12(2020)]|uniref:hypothetical protein n=1 Tax=Clostridium TaxID=1485 RepID=UPI001C8B56C2|nr:MULTISPECIES: hypothetical protein [unclassified Clostridium]MBX9136121.1 hypothetical protein [Clostridium sp. K12(2020)]MBX9143247.1 hypothetical protein [Clostridium sp. K13]MDU2292162.1 hypothetical protein [Clostridium celatum]
MPIALVTALISAGGLVLGSAIGAICSWFISKFSLHEQKRLQKENLNYQQQCKCEEKYVNANIIRLDFWNAIYQSIRYLQKEDNYSFYNCIPIYKEYHKIVASLCGEYSLKELSYIYQLYGILEECSKMVEFYWRNGSVDIITVRNAYKNVLEKIYGSNYLKVLSKNIDYIGYKDLCNDSLMKEGYRNVLKSLDEICNSEHEK